MKLNIRHRTYYDYAQPASLSNNQICLQPRDTRSQKCLSSRVEINPEPNSIQYQTDVFGNKVVQFDLNKQHNDCEIIVSSMVETSDTLADLPTSSGQKENLDGLKQLSSEDALMAKECLLPSPYIQPDQVQDALIKEVPMSTQSVLEYAGELMSHIFNTFEYQSGFSTLITPLSEIYSARKGVCQDFAHLAISVLRRQGIPARYVSGYLETLPPPGQKKLQGADASHAWFSVFDAVHGWYDFDPTNNKRPDRQYITTAWGRDYGDVAPVKGVVYGGGKHSLIVEVDVNRMSECVPEKTEASAYARSVEKL